MTLRNADRDSVRVTAVIHSLGQAGLPSPTVEQVLIDGNVANVHLRGQNGIRATVRLLKEDGHWRIADAEAEAA